LPVDPPSAGFFFWFDLSREGGERKEGERHERERHHLGVKHTWSDYFQPRTPEEERKREREFIGNY
jgi:hypothetical protein